MKKRNASHNPEYQITDCHETFFYDKDHQPCSEKEAYEIHLREYHSGNIACVIIADGKTKMMGYQHIEISGTTDSHFIGSIKCADKKFLNFFLKNMNDFNGFNNKGDYHPFPHVKDTMYWAYQALLIIYDESDITVNGEIPLIPYEYKKGVVY